jgi:hypothetical protein
LREAVDGEALRRLERLGLVERRVGTAIGRKARTDDALVLTERGRFLGGGVTAELLA